MTSNNAFSGPSFGYPSQEIFKERDEKMCSEWSQSPIMKELKNYSMKIYKNTKGTYVVRGRVKENILEEIFESGKLFVKYWAPNPPDYRYSYMGSALPFPNEDVAYENTPNIGVKEVIGDSFEFSLQYPNSYYVDMMTKFVEPHVHIQVCHEDGTKIGDDEFISLGEGVPYWRLTFSEMRDWSKGPMWYYNPTMPLARNQEEILRSGAFPTTNKQASNYWGEWVPPQ